MTRSILPHYGHSMHDTLWKAFVYMLLVAGAIVLMVPLAWMISTSLKSTSLVFVYPPQWIPKPPHWSNYVEALTVMPFDLYFLNTMRIVVPTVVGSVLTSSMVAYAFARLHFPFRNTLFLVMLSTLMLPTEVTMIPVFMIFKSLGWLNTFKPLQVYPFFGGGPFYIFLLRQFFASIPRDLEDAARIDGCGPLRMWLRIFLPLSKPALATVGIFSFMGSWNDFLGPLIYLDSTDKRTLVLGLYAFRGQYHTDWNLLMAASLVVMLPCLVMFFSAQKYFIQGIVFSGLKT